MGARAVVSHTRPQVGDTSHPTLHTGRLRFGCSLDQNNGLTVVDVVALKSAVVFEHVSWKASGRAGQPLQRATRETQYKMSHTYTEHPNS